LDIVTADSATAPAPLMTDAAAKREARRAYMRAWREKNPTYHRDRYLANPEKFAAAVREYRKANPEAPRVYEHRYRAKRAGTGGNITVAEMSAYRAEHGQACAACKITVKEYGRAMQIDHVMPLAKGGPNIIGNVQFLCGPCNSSKQAKYPIDWARAS
jgi:5-methylcytosine-specific restriction endonuclease McrA